MLRLTLTSKNLSTLRHGAIVVAAASTDDGATLVVGRGFPAALREQIESSAATLGITGAMVGDFIGADRGLGHLLLQPNFNMDISGMFAVLVVLALLGIVLYALVRLLHVRLVFWAKPDNLRSGPN